LLFKPLFKCLGSVRFFKEISNAYHGSIKNTVVYSYIVKYYYNVKCHLFLWW